MEMASAVPRPRPRAGWIWIGSPAMHLHRLPLADLITVAVVISHNSSISSSTSRRKCPTCKWPRLGIRNWSTPSSDLPARNTRRRPSARRPSPSADGGSPGQTLPSSPSAAWRCSAATGSPSSGIRPASPSSFTCTATAAPASRCCHSCPICSASAWRSSASTLPAAASPTGSTSAWDTTSGRTSCASLPICGPPTSSARSPSGAGRWAPPPA
mmetsp:Transcript_5165/g.12249  ORF Transcript_5165/g.12249 Transcript_5165/m.12249 type:complete len:213 (-) Transcript_5165:89-727(-)